MRFILSRFATALFIALSGSAWSAADANASPSKNTFGQADPVVQVASMQADRSDEQKSALSSYQKQVLKATASSARKKRSKINPSGLKDLRVQGMTIVTRTNLDKPTVKNKLDPIYEQLHGALVPSLEELYAVDDELEAARQALIDGGIEEDELVRVERVSAMYAICESKKHERIIADNLKLWSQLDPMEIDAIDSCNMRRLIMGLHPLSVDMKLVACGRDHSKDMHEKKFFDHVSPVPGKKTFGTRAENFGTSARAENIARGQRFGIGADSSWWHSPPHLQNMMGTGHRRFGVGKHERLWTQLLG